MGKEMLHCRLKSLAIHGTIVKKVDKRWGYPL